MRTDSTPAFKALIQPASRTATIYSEVLDASGYSKVAFHQHTGALGAGTATGTAYYATSAADLAAYQYLTAGDTWIPLRNGASDNVLIGHAFTTAAGSTPSFYQVTFRLKQLGTLSAGDYIWVTLEGDSTGDPDGTAIATSYKVDATAITTATAGELVTFTFRESTVAALTASTAYHVVLQGDYTASSSNQIQMHVDTVSSGGTIELYDSSWADVTTQTPPTTCLQIASWTAVSGYNFTAVTADNQAVETLANQTVVWDSKAYGPYCMYNLAETSAWTGCVQELSAVKLDPQYAT